MKLTLTKHRILALLLVGSGLTTLLGSGLSDRLRHWAQPALAPAGDGMTYLTTYIQREAHDLTAPSLTGGQADRLRRENDELRGRVLALEAALLKRIHQQKAIDALFGRVLSGFPCRPIPARVVGSGSLPYDSSRVLNVGRQRDAGAGQFVTTRLVLTDRSKALPPELAVITMTSLVGRITAAGPFTAQLQLITDKGFTLSAEIKRRVNPAKPRKITVVTASGGQDQLLGPRSKAVSVQFAGDGKEHLLIGNVSKLDNVLPGDVLRTSGGDGLLPAKVPIGTVIQAEDDPEYPGFMKLKVKPHADLTALREVYVIYPRGLPAAATGDRR